MPKQTAAAACCCVELTSVHIESKRLESRIESRGDRVVSIANYPIVNGLGPDALDFAFGRQPRLALSGRREEHGRDKGEVRGRVNNPQAGRRRGAVREEVVREEKVEGVAERGGEEGKRLRVSAGWLAGVVDARAGKFGRSERVQVERATEARGGAMMG
ncbi:hypothetical protein Efla_006075 [Eimeria flavescens]